MIVIIRFFPDIRHRKFNSHAVAEFFVDDLFDALPEVHDGLVQSSDDKNGRISRYFTGNEREDESTALELGTCKRKALG